MEKRDFQASVVQRLDSPIQLASLTLIRWIVIYLVDSAIQRLNNWGQGNKRAKCPEGVGGGGGCSVTLHQDR